MARVAQPKIPMRIYQHFAVVTIVVTLGVAVFADGETREAAGQEVTPQTAPVAKSSTIPKLARSKTAGSFGEDEGGSAAFGDDMAMGSASDTGSDRGNDSGIIPDELPDDATTNAALAAGYPASVLAAMSVAEREQLVKSLRDAGIADSEVRQARAASLLASSQQRSGGTAEPGIY